jgi:TonB family protein
MSSIACKTALTALLALAACGGTDKAATPEQPAAPPPAEAGAPEAGAKPKDDLQVAGVKGVLQNAQIQSGVAPHAAALEACYKDQLKLKKFLSGKVLVEIQVGKTGQVTAAGVVESDLGDWTVEKCLLGLARQMSFAKPTGGNGEAAFKLPVNFTSDQPPLEAWPEEQIAQVVAEKRSSLDACTGVAGAAPSSAAFTLYVGNRGKVEAVGLSSPAQPPVADAWAECATKAVAAWTFADPQGKIVKTGFHYPPEGK